LTIQNLKEVIEDLENPDVEIKLRAIQLLYQKQEQGVDISSSYNTLQELLCNDNDAIKWAAAEVLTQRGAKKYPWQYSNYSSVIKTLKEGSIEEKIEAAKWLSDLTEPNLVGDRNERDIEFAIPYLTVSLFNEHEEVIVNSLRAIQAAIGQNQNISDSFPALMKLLEKKMTEVRILAALIIRDSIVKKLDLSEYIQDLNKYLLDKEVKVKWAIADAITYYYALKEEWNEIKLLLFHVDKDVRQEAAGTLAEGYELDIQPLMNDLKKLLVDQSEDVKLVAARTIVNRAKTIEDIIPTIPIIIKLLNDEKDEVRIYTANIFYKVFDFLFGIYDKTKKEGKVSEDLWQPIQMLIPILKNSFSDKNDKIRNIVAGFLPKYYLRTNQSEYIIEILKNCEAETEKAVLKTLECDYFEKPESVIRYIADKNNVQLIKQFNSVANSGTKELNLSGTSPDSLKIYDIPPEIGVMVSLTRLDLSSNFLTTLPKEIGNLINLNNLILNNNKIKLLPEELGNLQNLQWLYLYRNLLKELPKGIGNLKKLEYIQLIQNDLETLPKEIENLQNLRIIEAQENKIKMLPKEIGNLQQLERLYLQNNLLSELPKETVNLQKLKSIDLSTNKINIIPELIFQLKQLEDFNFAYNNLEDLPKEIGNLLNLKTLYLRRNKLKLIPKEIGLIPNLRYIDISNNELVALPEELLNMKNLEYLDLEGNKLNIPEDILRLHTSPSRQLQSYFGNKSKIEI